MDKPGYIKPPPGLIPSAPSESTESTGAVRRTERRHGLPIFVPTPPGQVPSPTHPPAVPAEDTVAEVPEPAAEVPEPLADAESRRERARPRHSDSPPQWSLTLHDGSVIHVSGTLLLGRDPTQLDEWRSAGLLRINDPEKSVSKTHVGLDCRTDEFWIVDLYSTNGVVVIDPAGAESVLEPGVKASIMPGSTVELGRYAIRVDRQ